MLRSIAVLVLTAGLLVFAPISRAQSNDGFHSLQVIPVAVDSASFTQRFIFRPWLLAEVTIAVRYYPAEGTSLAQPMDCPEFTIASEPRPARKVFTSLRELCPGLPAGSQFGLLYLREVGPGNQPFAAYSRVSNSQGIGFSVEAFPPHLFGPAPAIVDGVRRLAATANTPAFQTNCFLANLGELSPSNNNWSSSIDFAIIKPDGTGYGSSVSLPSGRFVRLLDVFAAAGVPPGDVDDAEFRFINSFAPSPDAPVVGFCTVQDNSSFGADFRIAKPDQDPFCPDEGCDSGMGDGHVMRYTLAKSDIAIGGLAGSTFSIPAGPNHQNSHVMYFRHPDVIGCRLRKPDGSLAAPDYGLEMRLLDALPIAGGDGVTGFSDFYLGDKFDSLPINHRYLLQVESNGQNEGNARPYWLQCESGSGHTRGDTVYRDRPVDEF